MTSRLSTGRSSLSTELQSTKSISRQHLSANENQIQCSPNTAFLAVCTKYSQAAYADSNCYSYSSARMRIDQLASSLSQIILNEELVAYFVAGEDLAKHANTSTVGYTR